MGYKRKWLAPEKDMNGQNCIRWHGMYSIPYGRMILLMTTIVLKKIIVFIENDAELNALSNEDKIRF